jgi:hypothetical protein
MVEPVILSPAPANLTGPEQRGAKQPDSFCEARFD